MTTDESRIASSTRIIGADAETVFELISNPARQPEWDGNDNLAVAVDARRVRAVGDVFAMSLTMGAIRENHVVEFVEGRRIAWKPAEPGNPPVGHLWRWEVEPVDAGHCSVTHTYDWTELHDENRFPRARATTSERLSASIDRLAASVERA
jgi:uncharacterized protein YndB with AHSA1/START domain